MTQYVFSSWDRWEKCDHASKCIPTRRIIMPIKIFSGIVTLLEEFDSEFMVYFKATETQDGNWEISDISIPEQEVTSVSADAIEPMYDVQGIFHSHVTMSSFMSSTDNDHINANHKFSIVGNKDGKFEGITKEDLPCGGIFYKKAKLILQDPEENRDWIAIAKEKIKDKVYSKPDITTTETTEITDVTKEDHYKDINFRDLKEMSNEEFEEYMSGRTTLLDGDTYSPTITMFQMTDEEYEQFRIEYNHKRSKEGLSKIKIFRQVPKDEELEGKHEGA